MNDRNEGFDALKGLLLIFVIMGHVLLGEISENLGREIIYFFHMPLFLAITGFFIKEAFLRKPPIEILKKYYRRMLIPFMVAYIFYSVIWLVFKSGFSLDSITHQILYPYYHLWYIPSIVLFTFYIKLLDLAPKYISNLILFLLVSLTIFFEGYGQSIDNTIYMLLGDKRFYYYFTYFYVGYYISSKKTKVNNDLALVTFVFGLLIYGYSEHAFLHGLGKFLSNISLILILLTTLKNISYTSSFLSKIGKVSLPIYLWHVAPFLILKKLPIPEYQYYSLCVLIFPLFIYTIIKLEGKVRVLDRYFFGIMEGITKTYTRTK